MSTKERSTPTDRHPTAGNSTPLSIFSGEIFLFIVPLASEIKFLSLIWGIIRMRRDASFQQGAIYLLHRWCWKTEWPHSSSSLSSDFYAPLSGWVTSWTQMQETVRDKVLLLWHRARPKQDIQTKNTEVGKIGRRTVIKMENQNTNSHYNGPPAKRWNRATYTDNTMWQKPLATPVNYWIQVFHSHLLPQVCQISIEILNFEVLKYSSCRAQ